MDYLRSFTIASSWLVFVGFFLRVANIPPSIRNYSYEFYTVAAPLYFGIMNMLSLYLAKHLDLSLRQRMLLISVISILVVLMIAVGAKSYDWDQFDFKWYAFRIFVFHMLAYNVVIYLLERGI